jgi:uncharacterized membrane-anchored protein
MIGTKVFTLKTGVKVLLEVLPIDPRSLFRGEYVDLSYKISTIEFSEDKGFRRKQIIYVILEKKGRFWEAVDASKERPSHLGKDPERVVIVGKVLYTHWEERVKLGNFSDFSKEGWLEENPGITTQIKSVPRWWVTEGVDVGDTLYIPYLKEEIPYVEEDEIWVVRRHWISKDSSEVFKEIEEVKGESVVISAEVVSIERIFRVHVEYGIESYFVPEGKAIEIERLREPSKISVEVCVDRFGNSAINEIFINGKSIREFL